MTSLQQKTENDNFLGSRVKQRRLYATIAQLVEHLLGKQEVAGPNPASSSKNIC